MFKRLSSSGNCSFTSMKTVKGNGWPKERDMEEWDKSVRYGVRKAKLSKQEF